MWCVRVCMVMVSGCGVCVQCVLRVSECGVCVCVCVCVYVCVDGV